MNQSDDMTDDTKDALEMMGIPIVQFEKPSIQLVDTGKGTFKTVSTTGWIKFSIAFRNVMHRLKGAKLAVFLAICLHVNEDGEAWPSIRTIAVETGFDKGTVSSSISELEEIPGLMAVVRREGTSNLYRPSFAVYGKYVHTPPENTYTPPPKIRTEVESLSRTIKAEKPLRRSRAAPSDELLIARIPHGSELQAELSRAYESKGRKAPTHFENCIQRDAYVSCAAGLNGKFMSAVSDALSRGRESRGALLATLKAWQRNERINIHDANHRPTHAAIPDDDPEGLARARRLSAG